MAGISRPQAPCDVSPRVSSSQSRREKRSLERSAESHGRARPLRKTQQAGVARHGFSFWSEHSLRVGNLGFPGALCNSKNRHVSRSLLHAALGTAAPHVFSMAFSQLGTSL